ncbi:TonB-dependent receptor [Spongiibacter taiwanensis]|uniref:TonB-dependent receptor n=1 Tax=Spongiibacter taiwanensis TaxID=1748242 RepID=UPI002034BB22|nr:TonB-dependent receptor [Spongiibacter taiwanensis]USA42555.1 TonB-dependent receptor [Spongiibacter taiwanensis]
MNPCLIRGLCVVCAVGSGTAAVAQEPAQSKRSANRLLEEVTVTAQKREENSQDVPISIQAFSQEKLDAYGIENTMDLAKITPGLTMTYTYGYTVVYLRGVGTDAFLPSADPSVATYIDGINVPPGHGKKDALGPVERVEILKGPQGTLFGRNSTAGAINMITPRPPEEFVGSLKVEEAFFQPDGGEGVSDVEKTSYSLYMGAPLTDNIGFTVAYFEDLPYIIGENRLADGTKGPMREDYTQGARLKLVWDITDTLSLELQASEVSGFNGPGFIYEETRSAQVLTGANPAEQDADYVWHNDFQGGVETVNTVYGAILEWRPGPVDIKAILSDVNVEIPFAADDYDGSYNNSVNFFTYHQFGEQETVELQVLSNDESWMADKLEWVAGYYHFEGSGGFERLFFNVYPVGTVANAAPITNLLNAFPIVEDILQDPFARVTLEAGASLVTKSDAVYAQGTWRFNDDWSLTLGARYQDETRGIENSFLDYVRTAPDEPDGEYYRGKDRSRNVRLDTFNVPDVNTKTVSPRIAVQYTPVDGLQLYSSLSRGYKSPTYNTINFFSDPDLVEKETATAFELGFKSDLFENLRLNGAVFHTEIKNILTGIVSLTSGGVVRFSNAGKGEIDGAELDFQWQPMPDMNPGLAVTGSATYLDAVYTDYKNGAGFDDETGLYFGPDSPTGDNSRDFSGNSIVRTPDFSYQVALNQAVSAGRYGDLEFGLDYFYSGGYNTSPQNSPFYEQPAYDLWNARVNYFYDPYGLQVTLFGNNIANEKYYSTLLQTDFGRSVTLAAPRLVGIKVKWDFDTLIN